MDQKAPCLLLINKNINQTPKINKNDIIISIKNSDKILNKEVIDSSPLLTIRELEGKIFKNDNIIKLNASGILEGKYKCKVKTGVILFGIRNSSSISDVDLFLDEKKNLSFYKSYPYIFSIYYEEKDKNYFLKPYMGDESDNKIFFVKLNNSYDLPLKEREIVNIGSTIFQFIPLDKFKIQITILARQNLSISNNNSTFVFNKDEIQEITIGRNYNCTFPFEYDKSLSKIQTTILWDEKGNSWVIKDGYKFKESTNGTWVFGLHSFLIKDNLILEILNAKIIFNLNI